jgi:hypothetical protein
MKRTCVLAVIALSASAGAANAQVYNWRTAASGTWHDPVSWNPTGIPDQPGESAVLGLTGPYTVTLGSDVSLDQLTITNPEATLFGVAVVTGSVTNAGILSPGTVDLFIGTLTVHGSYTQQPFGALEVQCSADGAHDEVVVSGAARLQGGELYVSDLEGNFVPDCTDFVFLRAEGGVTGAFNNNVFTVHPSGRGHIVYTDTTVSFRYLAADINANGVIDFFDYLDFVAALDSGDQLADFNHDGFPDFFDYLDFAERFDSGC